MSPPEGSSRVARAGALYEAGYACTENVAAVAVVERLGRDCVCDLYLQRFLLDVADGGTSIPPRYAAPAFPSWARSDPGAVKRIVESDRPAAAVAALGLGRSYREFRGVLLTACASADPAVRLAAVAGLEEAASRGSLEATEVLAGLLNDRDLQIAWSAAMQLGAARGKRCVSRASEALRQVVAGADERRFTAAIFGLVRLRPVGKRELLRLLNVTVATGGARERAVMQALRHLPYAAGVGLAKKALENGDPWIRAMGAAAYATWADGEPAAREALIGLAGDAYHLVRAEAAEVLAGLSDYVHLAERFVADPSPAVRVATAQGLGRASTTAASLLLSSLARDGSPLVRATAATALGICCKTGGGHCPMGADSVRALLLKMTADQDGMVARAAVRALGAHVAGSGDSVWDQLVALCRHPSMGEAAAKAVAAALDSDASTGATIVWRWRPGPDVAEVLSRIARRARTWQAAEAARTLWRVVENTGGEVGICPETVRDASIVLSAAGEQEAAELLSWLPACISCNDLEGITGAWSERPRAWRDAWRARRGEPAARARLAGAGEAISRLSSSRSPEEKGVLPARVIAILEAILEHPPVDLESLLIERVARVWLEIMERDKERTHRTSLRATLISRSILRGPSASVMVLLENSGSSPVTDINIACSDGGEPNLVVALDPGESREVEVACSLAVGSQGSPRIAGQVTYLADGSTRECRFSGEVRSLHSRRLGPVANPYVVGKPLVGNSSMFFGREAEIEAVERALAGDHAPVLVLVGQRRTGKTSLAMRLAARLAGAYRPAFVDMQGMLTYGTDAFLCELVRPLIAVEGLGSYEAGKGLPALQLNDGGGGALSGAEMVREVVERSNRRVVLLLDEFDDLDHKVRIGRLDPGVLDQLRHLIQHDRNISLVLSGTHRLEELGGELWSFLLNLATYRRIGCLERQEAEQVVREPLTRLGIVCDDAAVARAVRLTGRHPYFLQLLGYRIVENCAATGEAGVCAHSVETAAHEVVEQGEIHLRYLWESVGEWGRPIVALLAERDLGLTVDQLQHRHGSNRQELKKALGKLVNLEIVAACGERYALQIELLAQWLRRSGNAMA